MKDRLVELSSPLALPIHPTLVYPKQSALAGQPLRAVGVVRGRPVWPVLGGSSEGDSSGGAGTGEEGDDDEGSRGSVGDGTGQDQGKGEGGNADAKIKALEEEKNRHYSKRQEAETALQAAQAKLKEIEDKDKTELERATSTLDEITKERDTLSSVNKELMLQNAFLSDNTFTWQNPARALQLADLSSVEFKDGKVIGLDKALEALAKSDPYLLKTEEKEDEGEQGGATGKAHNGAKGSKKGVDMAELKKKYPALRGR